VPLDQATVLVHERLPTAEADRSSPSIHRRACSGVTGTRWTTPFFVTSRKATSSGISSAIVDLLTVVLGCGYQVLERLTRPWERPPSGRRVRRETAGRVLR
jgi:hypothetical protein